VTQQKILVTGAYGLVGNLVFNHLNQQSELFTVFGLDRTDQPSNRIQPSDVTNIPKDQFFHTDLNDMVQLNRAVSEVDCVVHMAADSGGGNWESIYQNNLIGARNILDVCRENKVKRVVFASTVMVNIGYRTEEPYKSIMEGRFKDVPPTYHRLTKDDPTRPTGVYAASKVWGEQLGYMYSFNYGISFLSIRIGWVVAENRPRPNYGRSVWCSFRDICQLTQKCIQAPSTIVFDIYYGFSNNQYRFADLDHAIDVLGYNPEDSSEDFD
jgi:nucleoside-diphosphate-sugar epimerase